MWDDPDGIEKKVYYINDYCREIQYFSVLQEKLHRLKLRSIKLRWIINDDHLVRRYISNAVLLISFGYSVKLIISPGACAPPPDAPSPSRQSR